MTAAPVSTDRIEGFAQQLADAGADRAFSAEGLLFWCVPMWIVRAYAAARYARADVVDAMVVEAMGENEAAKCRAHPQAIIWNMARGWARRLADLERQVRSVGSVAA